MVTVAVLGVGEVGGPIARIALERGHETRLLTRQGSENKAVAELVKRGAKEVQVDYDDEQSIRVALRGVHVLLSALGGQGVSVGGKDVQLEAAKMAKEEGVLLFVPSMWGFDYQSATVMDPSTVNPSVAKKLDILASLNALQLPWIAISNGLFSSWSFSPFIGIEAKERKAAVKIDAEQEISFTHLDDIARFVEKVYANKEAYPQPGTGRWYYVESYKASIGQVLDKAQDLDGHRWSITFGDANEEHARQTEPTAQGALAWVIASLDDGRALRPSNDNEEIQFQPTYTLHSAIKELI